jgi:hypothetical protein
MQRSAIAPAGDLALRLARLGGGEVRGHRDEGVEARFDIGDARENGLQQLGRRDRSLADQPRGVLEGQEREVLAARAA